MWPAGGRDKDRRALDDGIVTNLDGINQQRTEPAKSERMLDEDGTDDQRSEKQARDGDDRDKGVSKGMLQDDDTAGQALGARRLDVVLRQGFDHG